jgi:hypothetical protein
MIELKEKNNIKIDSISLQEMKIISKEEIKPLMEESISEGETFQKFYQKFQNIFYNRLIESYFQKDKNEIK